MKKIKSLSTIGTLSELTISQKIALKSLPQPHKKVIMKRLLTLLAVTPLVLGHPVQAELSADENKTLTQTYQKIQSRDKGPYDINTCTCVNGELAPVADKDMRVRPDPCRELFNAKQLFCSAYRSKPAMTLIEHGVYVGNIFSNEVNLWEKNKDHHRLVKGFIFEKFQMDTNPEGKLSISRSYRGISGLEFEAKYAPVFFALYYKLPDWTDFRHYLLQYELQRRFFLSSDMVTLNDIRTLSMAMSQQYPPFKPVKDLIHNRLTADQAGLVEDFQRKHGTGSIKKEDFNRLATMIRGLTDIDSNRLPALLPKITNSEIRKRIKAVAELPASDTRGRLHALAELTVHCRQMTAARQGKAEEAVEWVNLAIIANQMMQVTAARIAENSKQWPISDLLAIAGDLMSGSYGAGLMSRREYETAAAMFERLQSADNLTNRDLYQGLERAGRVAEWAQSSVQSAFWDVWEPWVLLFPETRRLVDDIIRSSPLVAYASVIKSLRTHLAEELDIRHELFGDQVADGVRALNPGLCIGPLAHLDSGRKYSRADILAVESTNADLEPVAGIITRDEGNIVSHVQLLARALGIPNAVFQGPLYDRLPKDGTGRYFYAITPMGRIIFKNVSEMNTTDRAILEEYEKNKKRGDVKDIRGKTAARLVIDADKLNLKTTGVLPLEKIRRKDSGVICGPKAAFLGELKHLFPGHVSRGAVIPFGVYARHFSTATVAVPEALAGKVDAAAGSPLPGFVKATYDTFFNTMLRDATISPEKLTEWIEPRLAVIRHSIENMELDADFVAELRKDLLRQGLFTQGDRLAGVFVRSDTNVEDLPNFNGAGLNLTLFNLMTFPDVLDGIKKVWASPFTYRSFSWRQAVINDPSLVFPSLVVLESVASEKSGVLITADAATGEPGMMTIATAEGVGGTVDGSQAETLVVKNGRAEMLAQYKSPLRRMLLMTGKGGSQMVPSTGSEEVLSETELDALVSAAAEVEKNFEPETDFEGRPLPWDIEYGFVGGKLYLFQARPFAGNSDMRNLPALSALDKQILARLSSPFDAEMRVIWRP